MHFDQPLYLWLLIPALLLLGAFFWWAWREKRRLIGLFISARLLPSLTLGVSPQRQKARMVLLLVAAGLLLLALARMQIGFSLEEARSRGLDIVVAIDTSRSMLATDVTPNRLRRAQLAALDLKRLARADRLGVVAFAGSAFLQCPLTLDDEAFRRSIEALDVNIIPQGGTALAEAIQTARSAFKEGNDNHKVLVMFTDGEDHDGQAVDGAKEAAKTGMRIFTVGVGTSKGDVLRTTDAQGRTEFIKGPDGNAVRSQLNQELLEDIAQATGGFYRLLSGADTMNVIYDYGLAPLPKSELASQKIKRPHERFQWLLGLAIMLLLAEMLVPERTEPRRAGAAGAVKVAGVTVLLWLMAPAMAFCAESPAEALKEYRAGNHVRAQAAYEVLSAKKPGDARLRFNAGAAALAAEDYPMALQHFNAVLSNAPVELQQSAYYDMGNAFYRLGQKADGWDQKLTLWKTAVTNFEHAVALQSKDADARFNLEFARTKAAEIEFLLQLREEARRAKEQAEAARRRRDYHGAREILEKKLNAIQQATTNAIGKEYEPFANRLKDIDDIANPPRP